MDVAARGIFWIMVLVGWTLVPAIVASHLGEWREVGSGGGFFLGLFLSWFGVLIVAVIQPRPPKDWSPSRPRVLRRGAGPATVHHVRLLTRRALSAGQQAR
jgi:hypothetical protein